MQAALQAPVNITEFPYLQHVNALGRPRGDVGAGAARLVGTKLRPPPWVQEVKDIGNHIWSELRGKTGHSPNWLPTNGRGHRLMSRPSPCHSCSKKLRGFIPV